MTSGEHSGSLAAPVEGAGGACYIRPLERAAQMANHASTRTTQLYDRRADEVTLDEVERILV